MESLRCARSTLHDRGMTDTAIAHRLSVSPQKWNAWKTGRESMPTAKLLVLARLADLDPVALVGNYEIERARKTGKLASALGAVLVCLATAAGVAETAPSAPASRKQAIHYAKFWLVFRRVDRCVADCLARFRVGPPAPALA